MATPDQVSTLRELTNEPTDSSSFDNARLAKYIDVCDGSITEAASLVWSVKASQYADLVDTTEGSSSRKMSQLHANALKMSDFYGQGSDPSSGGDSGGGTTTGRTRVGRIVRADLT